MFLLIIIIFIATQTGDIVTRSKVLNTFEDISECEKEATRIAKDMHDAYPNEQDYIITCTVNERSKHGV